MNTNTKKRIKIFVISALLLLIASYIGLAMLNPIWLPSYLVEKRMLKIMPIGTRMDKAIEIIKSNNWEIDYISDVGYIIQTGQPRLSDSFTPELPAIGNKTIKITLGSSVSFIGGRDWLLAYLGFDDNGYLVDITVYKSYEFL
jgi:hypothetical protein